MPYNATLLSFRAFGTPGNPVDENLDLDTFIPAPIETQALAGYGAAPLLYVMVYRPTNDGSGSYSLVQNLTQIIHGFEPGRLPADRSETLKWRVQKGDFVGAYIPYVCVNRSSDSFLMCPSQINFVTNYCLSAFYHPAKQGVNNLLKSEFREVSTYLNMEVYLTPDSK